MRWIWLLAPLPLVVAGVAFALGYQVGPGAGPSAPFTARDPVAAGAAPAATALADLAPTPGSVEDAALPTPASSPAEVAAIATPSPSPTDTPVPAPTQTPVATPTDAALQPLLPDHRIIAYWGNPLATQMGILGEIAPDDMLSKLKAQVADYAAADKTRTVVPALELVTPAAQGYPGDDGLYRARMKPEVIDQVAGWAEANHALLILDVQIGLSTVPDEVGALLPYLRRPYVHLALDPEFAIPAGHVPGEVVGTMDASAINGAIHTLSDLVASEHLPPKILIIHRFTDSMVTNAPLIKPDPNVQVVIVMDGFGPPELKVAQYNEYVHNQGVQFAGIKLFYHHDIPLMSPQDVVDLDPFPDVVIYQ